MSDPGQNGTGNGWSLPTFAKVGVVGVLCFIVLFLLGVFQALGLHSPLVARGGESEAAARMITERIPASKKEHEDILEELQVMTYLLALPEKDRPRLPMPKRLRERIREERP